MRLIDADKLELKETVRIQLCGLKEYVALYSYTKDQIEEAPIVKAIPIEWINKWVVTKFVGAGRVIDSMLEDWEKENEKRTNS